MKVLELHQMEALNGGNDEATLVGAACGAVLLFGMFGGPVGLATLIALGPAACIANMALIAAS